MESNQKKRFSCASFSFLVRQCVFVQCKTRQKTTSKYGVHSNSESLFYYICTGAWVSERAEKGCKIRSSTWLTAQATATFEYMVSRTRWLSFYIPWTTTTTTQRNGRRKRSIFILIYFTNSASCARVATIDEEERELSGLNLVVSCLPRRSAISHARIRNVMQMTRSILNCGNSSPLERHHL